MTDENSQNQQDEAPTLPEQSEAQENIGQDQNDDNTTPSTTAPAPAVKKTEDEQQEEISASGVQVPAGPKVPGTDTTGKPVVNNEASI